LHYDDVKGGKNSLTFYTVERVTFLQQNVGEEPITSVEDMQGLIQKFIERHDEELEELAEHRKQYGKTPGARESQMRQMRDSEVRELETGFWMPDLADVKNVKELGFWSGEWVGLNLLKYVRIKKDGQILQSSFPPKGKS
jgi:translation machinery-associated protein 16